MQLCDVAARAATIYELALSLAPTLLPHGTEDQLRDYRKLLREIRPLLQVDQTASPDPGRGMKPYLVLGKGQKAYSYEQLLRFLQLATHLRSGHHFRLAVVTAVAVATGQDISAEMMSEKVSGSGPSGATLSRSKFRIDVLQMLLRRKWWQNRGFENHFINLCYDATKKRKELFVTEEFATNASDAMKVYMSSITGAGAGDPDSIDDKFSLRNHRRVLPLASMGQGYTSFPSKLDCLLHTIALEAGWENLEKYSEQVVSCTSDQGTERLIGGAARPSYQALQDHLANTLETTSAAVLALPAPAAPVSEPAAGPAGDGEPVQAIHGSDSEPEAEEVDADVAGVAGSADTEQEDVTKQFPNALVIHGLKHVVDNILQDVLGNMQMWPEMKKRLEILEQLLSTVTMRERFVALLVEPVGSASDVKQMEQFSCKLQSSRWEAITNFCAEVSLIEGTLRRFWDYSRFVRGGGSKSKNKIFRPIAAVPSDESRGPMMNVAADDDSLPSFCGLLDQTIQDTFTWCGIGVILDIGRECEHVGVWGELCPCCSPSPADSDETSMSRRGPSSIINICGKGFTPSCPFRGCRAPELAAGAAVSGELTLMSRQRDNVYQHLASTVLSESRQSLILSDIQTARARLLSQLCLKLAYWEELPYKLCGLAHGNSTTATLVARECLALWERGGPGNRHRQSRRFLDEHYRRTGDPPLRKLVERMAEGEMPDDMDVDERSSLVRWLSAFRSVRVVERTTEGIHSLVARNLRRAPAAKISYLSSELRLPDLMESTIHDPAEFRELLQEVAGIETKQGFRSHVLKLLGLNSSPYLEGLDQRQLANLLYRDNLRLKHSLSERYARDLQAKTDHQKMQHQLALKDLGDLTGASGVSKDGGMAKTVAKYLIKAGEAEKLVFATTRATFDLMVKGDLQRETSVQLALQLPNASPQFARIEDDVAKKALLNGLAVEPVPVPANADADEECELNLLASTPSTGARPIPLAKTKVRRSASSGDSDGMVFFRIVDRNISKTHAFQGSTVHLLQYDCVVTELVPSDETDANDADLLKLCQGGHPKLCLLSNTLGTNLTFDRRAPVWVCEVRGASPPYIDVSTEKKDLETWILGRIPGVALAPNMPSSDDLIQLAIAELLVWLQHKGWRLRVHEPKSGHACLEKETSSDESGRGQQWQFIYCKDEGSLPSAPCLVCLLLIDDLFRVGLGKFYFFQNKAYYECLLRALQLVLSGGSAESAAATQIFLRLKPGASVKECKQIESGSVDSGRRPACRRMELEGVPLEVEEGLSGFLARYDIVDAADGEAETLRLGEQGKRKRQRKQPGPPGPRPKAKPKPKPSIAEGAKPTWLKIYKDSTKVEKVFQSGALSMVCNLNQNPTKRAIVSHRLPTLLRNGLMWLLLPPPGLQADTARVEERYLLPKEHLAAMGLPVFQHLSEKHPFPVIDENGLRGITSAKSLAGNAFHAAVIGAIWATMFTQIG